MFSPVRLVNPEANDPGTQAYDEEGRKWSEVRLIVRITVTTAEEESLDNIAKATFVPQLTILPPAMSEIG